MPLFDRKEQAVMNTRTTSALSKSLRAMATATVLVLVGMGAAGAATLTHPAWATNNSINCTGFDALQLNATRNPGEGGAPFAGNTLLLLSDVTYWYPSYPCWESTTWTSNGTGRKAAKVSGASDNPNPTSLADLYLPADRFIKLRNLTIDNVELDYDNTALWFFTSGAASPAPDMSLTLNNASITGFNPPIFDSRANFRLSATGDSTVSNWWSRVSVQSPTTLNVTGAGSKLTFFRVGNTAGGFGDALYFHGANNTALIDGATLKLDQSSLTFGSPHAAPDPYGQMTFQNGATLELTGPDTKLESGNLSFVNSQLKMGLGRVKLTAHAGLTINGFTADIAGTGALTTPTLNVFGSNTIALPQEYSSTDHTIKTGIVVMEPDASLTLNGRGSVASDFQLRWSFAPTGSYGRLVINDSASLVNDGGTFVIIPGAPVTINRTNNSVYGSLFVRNGGVIELRGAGSYFANFLNKGQISAYAGGVVTVPAETYNIVGGNQGLISIGDDGRLDIGNFGSASGATAILNTDNRVWFENFSTLKLTLDPTARTNSRLRTSSELLIGTFADLNLGLVNDQVLPVGTKFRLIDYSTLLGTGAVAGVATANFNGHRDGSSFVLGLNRYQINYKDIADAGYTAAVTLTVVPMSPPVAALSPTAQTLTGTVGMNITHSVALVPSAFGGQVSYSVNPALPPGLRFDVVTGVISGVPSASLAATTLTIRGVGAVSGDAHATVNLTIVKANQSITFGPAPSATYSPGGVVFSAASASSGLRVAYGSLTPAVCTASNGSVAMLAAGTCIVTANQAGDSHYNAAVQVTQTVVIAKAQPAPLTLAASPVHITTVGGTSSLATSGGGGTGAISFSTTAPCSIAGSTLTGNSTGTCAVTATQAADTNYNAGQSNTVRVQVGAGAQAPLVLTASPTTLNVNGTSALQATGGSGSGAVSYAVSSGPCTLAGSILTGTAVGQCQVVASKAADGGFGPATSNPVTLTVRRLTPVPLVLTATPVSVGLGGTSTLATSGGISGSPVNYRVTGPCAVNGNILTGVSVGNCVITATQAETPTHSAATSNTLFLNVKERLTSFSYPATTATSGQALVSAPITSGFTMNARYALLYGSLPAGLTLNPLTGVITGTLTGAPGTYDFAVSVFENNAYDAALVVITLQVPPAGVPTLSQWGVILLAALMALATLAVFRRRAA
jgi:hypothetical protein